MMTAVADRNALLQHARELRTRDRVAEALAVLAELATLHPRFSRLYQEQAQCHLQRRDAAAAFSALHEALRLNPTLPACWDMLAQLCKLRGDEAGEQAARQRLAIIAQLPRAVVMADSLLADGDVEPAESVMRDYLREDPGNVGALRLLARIRMERDAHDDAEALLRIVLDLAPDFDAARLDYAMALLQQQKHQLARHEAGKLLSKDPARRAYLKQYAAACMGLGEYEPVVDIYERLLAPLPPTSAEAIELRLWRANALKIVGRRDEAIADYKAALAANPACALAWFGLANLKTYLFDDDEIAAMRSVQAADLAREDRVYLDMTLAKALEDRGDYAASWRYFARGNALRHAAGSYAADAASSCCRRLQQTFSPAFFAERAGWGVGDAAPIFIVGLPRSGSTLIEQILASHPQVEGTQELTQIGRYAGELFGIDPACGLPDDPAAATRLTAMQIRDLGERFLADTHSYRRLSRPFFIDKMPNNFWHIGLIHLILPNATIIDVRREPMSCGFSIYKQLFGTTNQPFAYDLRDIGRYYRDYLQLMTHWERVLPGRVMRVAYEDVVHDLADSVRRLLARCGLPFDPACLAFHLTRRSVRTPSSEQVRQPIGRDGLDQWRHYAPWLAPLRQALGDAVERHRS